PPAARIDDVAVATSVRQWQITVDAALEDLQPAAAYRLRAVITAGGETVRELASDQFSAADLDDGRFAFTQQWHPDRLWDLHTPQNTYDLQLSLLGDDGAVLDTCRPVRFGFRELWIDGRDFILNGTRLYCCAVPLDNAQIGATAACYEGARESMLRQKALGVNLMYTHNYDCLPGSHLGFDEILRAADDVGMLISFSMPHVKDYDWDAPDADATNGYAKHAEFYVRQARNHPSVVMYSMNHNYTGYSQDMNPDLIDGIYNPFPDPSGESDLRFDSSARLARRGEAIVRGLDPTRVIYHHSSGNNGQLHTINCYLNFVPIQERSDWFEHWATEGVKPVFLCEYGVPIRMSWTMHRGWYEGRRYWTNGKLKYQFCTAEWGSQFLGDRAFELTEPERQDLRWEAQQWRAGATWYRWDYPFQVNNTPALGVPNIDDVQAMYIADNWRAFRTWGVSAINLWGYGNKWKLREGVDDGRRDLEVDWESLQRPGFSPDFIERRYERIDTAYEVEDWIPTKAAQAFLRHNQPVLAYIGGGPERFTSKDHNFNPGETVHKQIIAINSSREAVTCECSWSLALPEPVSGTERVSVPPGDQARVPLRLQLPPDLPPGEYTLTMRASFTPGGTQEDALAIHVLPHADMPALRARVALFDPEGETAELLEAAGVECHPVQADADLSAYDVLVVGRRALTTDGPAPDIGGVREGLRVLVFEQTAEALERRLGFRVQDHGIRRAFSRVPDHPLLEGLGDQHLRDWRGEATLLPPRRDPGPDPNSYPSTRWCGIEVSRAWRCGCRGNVASVVIEKPAAGDFLPIVDAGFSLQYAPLMLFREGLGMVLFCQMDVTGRSEEDPAAGRLVANMLRYVAEYSPPARRTAVYAGEPAGGEHLARAGIAATEYGGPLAADQVLVIGPAGNDALAPRSDAIAEWLQAGGRVLALGLDEAQLRECLPLEISTRLAEHIDAHFDPPATTSPLAGVGPADVLIREPREIPLVAGGADIVGDGVLATAAGDRIVLCQLAPWQFDYQDAFHVKMTYRRLSFLVNRLLANLGVGGATPLLERFSSPVEAAGAGQSLVRNGDFSADEDGDGAADHWSVTAGSPQASFTREQLPEGGWAQRLSLTGLGEDGEGSVMLAQHDVPLREGQWYRVSLRARAEGLRGARINFTVQNTETWRSFFDYQHLAPDEQWREHSFLVQSNATADSGTRLQLWYSSVGTVWFSDVLMVPCSPPSEGRWASGLYLDEPVEMDDPYRFFRW
ncbi:MAG: glycoside hydrolase family 2 TIM barrel-domain containing protein, partial [Armatimonadota bacterium]